MEGLTLRNGRAGLNGGGMLIQGFDAITSLRDVRFLNNWATTNGGGISSELGGAPGRLVVNECEFIGNRANGPSGGDGSGGAIVMIFPSGLAATVTNSLFVNNTCRLRGGALYLTGNSQVRMTNNTIVGHPLTDVGTDGLLVAEGAGSELAVRNCVFADNDQSRIQTINGTTGSVGSCVLQDYMTLDGAADAGGNVSGTPVFEQAASGDYRLASDSIGIDAANADDYIAVGGPQTDLRGVFRYADDPGTPNTGTGALKTLDIGAFEFQGVSTGTECEGDINHDDMVNFDDLNVLLSNWGATCN